MVKSYLEKLTPGMKARLDAPHRDRRGEGPARPSRSARKVRHGSVNCVLSDALKMPYNRVQT